MPGRRDLELVLTDAGSREAHGLSSRRSAAQVLPWRARVILAFPEASQNQDVVWHLSTCVVEQCREGRAERSARDVRAAGDGLGTKWNNRYDRARQRPIATRDRGGLGVRELAIEGDVRHSLGDGVIV